MNQSDLFDLIKLLITVVSIVFAVWQYLKNRRIKNLIALEAVELHQNVGMALGAIQAAKAALTNALSPSIEIGRTEGLCQTILFESAKLYCNLKNTKIDDIDDLISNGQLKDNYKNIYYSFSNRRRGWFRSKLKIISKFF